MHYKISFIFLVIISIILSCGKSEKPAGQKYVVDGAKIYRKFCITCHGVTGDMKTNGAKDLTESDMPLEERILQITNGKGLMTPFKGILNEKKIKAVAEYSMTLRKKE